MTGSIFQTVLVLMYGLTALFSFLLFIKVRKIIRTARSLSAAQRVATTTPEKPAEEKVSTVDLEAIYAQILRVQETLNAPRVEDAHNIPLSKSIRESEVQALAAAPNIRLRRVK